MGADDFVIKADLNKALFGFGDAVCVPVVAWIARHYLNPLVEEMLRNANRLPAQVALCN
jgi:DNA (cytosine-5)-methyltransferase 1